MCMSHRAEPYMGQYHQCCSLINSLKTARVIHFILSNLNFIRCLINIFYNYLFYPETLPACSPRILHVLFPIHTCLLSRRLWVFADVPHLVKLLRTHVMMEGGGLLVPNSRGSHSLLARKTFEDLLALEPGDLRVCHKLSRLCIEVIVLLVVPFVTITY